jgi:hypothetical protein
MAYKAPDLRASILAGHVCVLAGDRKAAAVGSRSKNNSRHDNIVFAMICLQVSEISQSPPIKSMFMKLNFFSALFNRNQCCTQLDFGNDRVTL